MFISEVIQAMCFKLWSNKYAIWKTITDSKSLDYKFSLLNFYVS